MDTLSLFPATSYSHKRTAPNYHRRRSFTSVFGLWSSMTVGSLRQLRSFSPRVHRTLRASLPRFLDLLGPSQPRVFLSILFLYFLVLTDNFLHTKKEYLLDTLSFCPATSYSHKGTAPNYHWR